MLQTTRCRMLREMFGGKRRFVEGVPLESWVDFIKRSTHKVEDMMTGCGLQDWVAMHKRRKWRFAGRTARADDERWSTKLINWQPPHGQGRAVGHPNKRWADEILKYCGGNWMETARDERLWEILEEGYILTHQL